MSVVTCSCCSHHPAEEATPWPKLALGGIAAAFSELFELMREWQFNPLAPFGLEPQSWQLGGITVLDWLPLLFAVLAIACAGLATYKNGWRAISSFTLNINALMAVAVTGAVIIGHYPEAAMVMVLFNLAETLEDKALDRARHAIKDLLDLAPDSATVLQPDGSWAETDVRLVALGSRVRVRPGEKIGLDGRITQGHSTVNQATITGESLPVEKSLGDAVYAGTINESGSFEFEVTAAVNNSTLARIIRVVEEAQESRAPMQRFVDRFAAYYTPAIFLTALLAAFIPPLFLGGVWIESVYTALIVLVIGCPCALVISTPISIVSGLAAATRQGILIKGGVFLEQGRLLKWLAFDKTGTITQGKPRLTDFIELSGLNEASWPSEIQTYNVMMDKPGQAVNGSRAMLVAASLAARSDHPVSRAIAEHAAENKLELLEVENFTAIPGQGVSGRIKGYSEDQTWQLGNLRLAEAQGQCPPELKERIAALEKTGKTVVVLIGKNGVQGLFAVADTLRDSSLEAIRELKQLGLKTMLLTGDNEHAAKTIAEQAGLDGFRAGLLPEDKLRIVEQITQQNNNGSKNGKNYKDGKVGMVGDGINDAPALARADIGFAMAACGTGTAIETADVALMDDDLRKIPRFIGLSRATHAILLQNIGFALGLKALFLGLTLMGLASMWMAVFADVGATLLVIANGLRAMRIKL
ncbi:MAG: heavy metal translocating P-type ATPase [Deltaproteobacteria bacterium]|jgi:Cd2+/Zn2+-exporting ATPase|nr:heavy metal translocating P-type ATPase [Deltaproteobacteria bacterium]